MIKMPGCLFVDAIMRAQQRCGLAEFISRHPLAAYSPKRYIYKIEMLMTSLVRLMPYIAGRFNTARPSARRCHTARPTKVLVA